jgi:sporulation protein YlmC with PRC-barrel domain
MENSMPEQVTIKKTDPEKRFRRVLSASTLAGDRVKNSAGEDLGNVHEIMIDISSGTVAYAVLSFGGFLGMGDKLCALPWGALTLDEDEIALELQNISRPCSTASAGVSRSSHEVGALERPFDVDRF